ncbi:hypothetical protein [Cylindrospermum sp. FACHB-282]|uniref:hypothetical protein n=1 Tax=Cylindrospermum sp. FACHB-282 TaxID=2692794 RepID=UPI001689F7DF|nr:hypothetical protein [Cylindrospermum sp. FACHB-282]MBD2385401.1 hypothetical protein [Cylindrospermum sp. FACHB-282]
MNKRHWLEMTEYVLLGFSILGTIPAGVTQQVVYAAVLLSLSMALNLANRQKLNYSQLQQNLHNHTNEFYQRNKIIDTFNQRLEQIDAGGSDWFRERIKKP